MVEDKDEPVDPETAIAELGSPPPGWSPPRKRGRPPGPRIKPKRPRPLVDSPLVASTDARAKVEAAAAAAGLTIAELADLMADNGFYTLPPKDELTQRYTLEDLGKRLWASLQEQAKPFRVEWFQTLTPVQQASLLTTLRDQGFHFEVIAAEFAIPVKQVVDAWNRHCDELGSQVVGIRLETIAGQLQSHASRAQHMAMDAEDHKSFWAISRDYIGMLQSLGIVDRAIHRVDHQVTHRFEDQQRLEIEALVALERKKEARFAELKVVDATVVDSVPQLTVDYDDEEQEKL